MSKPRCHFFVAWQDENGAWFNCDRKFQHSGSHRATLEDEDGCLVHISWTVES